MLLELAVIFFSLSFLFYMNKIFISRKSSSCPSKSDDIIPKSYPLIGSYPALFANRDQLIQWMSNILQNSPSQTFVLQRVLGHRQVITANPSNVQHILKTHFHIYHKGAVSKANLSDFLGDGIFNSDGESWKFQRQVSSHEFNTKSLRKFVETVVDTELSDRLIPILSAAADNQSVLDLQDILQRFAFDNICNIAFGYDPAYLLPSLPKAKFAEAFEDCVRISSTRFQYFLPIIWKFKRFFGLGCEKQLKIAIAQVREFAKNIIREKKQELNNKSSLDSVDLLSRFLSSGHSDDDFVTDIVISFILAGRDTTSAALTWFFFLVSKNPQVEDEILKEISHKYDSEVFDEVKHMDYIHASLCESMRLYPPVPIDSKEANVDDILPDGTIVKKGMRVTYHPYAMGRSKVLWGSDWSKFRPERWLEKDPIVKKWSFVVRDPYEYPVFQAGPRICLGKEMAFLQMKRVVAEVLRRFQVVPAAEVGVDPIFISYLSSKMKGGFSVKFVRRDEKV